MYWYRYLVRKICKKCVRTRTPYIRGRSDVGEAKRQTDGPTDRKMGSQTEARVGAGEWYTYTVPIYTYTYLIPSHLAVTSETSQEKNFVGRRRQATGLVRE